MDELEDEVVVDPVRGKGSVKEWCMEVECG
jgi:hypothetical protein